MTGRVAKLPIIQNDCNSENPFLLAFTETHLNDTCKESEFSIPSYSNFMSHRRNRTGGGVIIYLKNNLTGTVVCEDSDEMCSFLAVHINELNLVFLLAYRPPPNPDTERFRDKYLELSFDRIVIKNINSTLKNLDNPKLDIIIAGDFNFPRALWTGGVGTPPNGCSSESKMLTSLMNMSATHHLLQMIDFGTRPNISGSSNPLDLIFTNNDQMFNHISHRLTSLSDHVIISCNTKYLIPGETPHPPPPPINPPTLKSFNFFKADWNQINESLNNINWKTEISNKNVNEFSEFLLDTTLNCVSQHCPEFINKPGRTNSKIPRDRRILFRQRKRKTKLIKYTTLQRQRRLNIEKEIMEIERKLIISYREQYAAEEENAINNIKSNPKYFYSFARKKQVRKDSVGPLKVEDRLITDPLEICNTLANQYASAFSKPDVMDPQVDPLQFFAIENSPLPCLLDINFTIQDIEDEIDNLKNNSAPGPDNFPVMLLKSCKKSLSKPIYELWRKSLDTSQIADIHKHAIIAPIPKPGSVSHLAKSYRPISLTSHITKIFEKVIRKAIIKHMQENNLLPNNQHGFIHGRSTLSQLLNQVEIIIRSIEADKDIDTIYLDFAKAFDKVDHKILATKLKEMRIGGKVGMWLYNFLSHRTQQISANGAISPPTPVLSGVPQGTVLGPILFVIMISDLDKSLTKSFASLFADDSRVSAQVKNESDRNEFQNELDSSLYPWAQANKAVFNGDKFEHIHFGKIMVDNQYQYLDPNKKPITSKPEIKDLGVTISSSLDWSPHINKIIAQCRRQAAWILRTFSNRDPTTITTLWKSLIRPIIDYCSPLWSPAPNNYGNIDSLESVLRSFSKHIDGLQNSDYKERLTSLKLSSVQRRHERYKIIYVYKIKEGLVPNLANDPSNPEESFALLFKYNSRHGYRCSIPHPRLHHNPAVVARNGSFSSTASDLWNCLPRCINSLSNVPVNTFKAHLDKFLDLFPDDPRCSASGQYTDINTGRISNSIWHMCKLSDIQLKIAEFEKDWSSSRANRGGPRRGNPPP